MQIEVEEKETAVSQEIPSSDIIFKKPGFNEVFGSILGVSGLLLLLALVSHNSDVEGGGNLIGTVGFYTADILFYLFGNSSYITGPYIILMGYFSLRRGLPDPLIRFLALFIMVVSSSLYLNSFEYFDEAGLVGRNLGDVLQFLFGYYGSFIIGTGLFLTSVFMSSQIPSRLIFERVSEWLNGTLYPWLAEYIPWIEIRKKEAVFQEEESEMHFEKEISDYKPWFEKKEELLEAVTENEEKIAEPESIPEKNRETGRNFENRKLGNLLDQLERKYNPDSPSSHEDAENNKRLSEMDRKKNSSLKEYFSGRFSDDESRFIFSMNEGKKNNPELFRDTENTYFQMLPENISAENEIVTFDKDSLSADHRISVPGPLHEEEIEDDVFSDLHEGKIIMNSEGGTGNPEENDDENIEDDEEFVEIFDRRPVSPQEEVLKEIVRKKREDNSEIVNSIPPVSLNGRRYYIPPELLNAGTRAKKEDITREIEHTKKMLESVMQDYGIQAHVVTYQRGPIVTLYEVKLEPGVKVSKINGIYDEIKMNLAAASLRIIAPIPGKSTVGIEIPNKTRESVELGQMIRNDTEFFSRTRELSISLGKNITGENSYVDLVRLPHLLIAGATGAGKSVYMNAVIASLLYTHSPEELRFIMIDPKMVELKLFDGIPHLLLPVITDVRKSSRSLQWAVQEMERRYLVLSNHKVRDIRSYNSKIKGQNKEKMPYIVILIDELSDLMMVAAKDVEDSIIRLTQKARAVGIHMIMATQRPSVDVITALIKANCPARISFQVSQKTDSRTILDANGAETLMGKGDMLYKSPVVSGLERIQAPMITENEIEKIVKETLRYGNPGYIDLPDDVSDSDDSYDGGADIDPALIQDAWKIIQESGKTSTSYIQRRLRIGYNRAANIVETLEEMGYLGPVIGNKPRDILKRS